MKNKLLVILGSTSTGKTDLALHIAKLLNGELVSADSRQVYKYLDIGTGKLPSQNDRVEVKKDDGFWEMNKVKVWLYDVVSPDKRFNLHQYIIKAKDIINKLSGLEKLPILVGGTGLYIRSLLEGVSDFGFEENLSLRSDLEKLNLNQIQDKIKKISPQTLTQLNNSELNNKRRLIRIFEKLTAQKNLQDPFPGMEKDYSVLKIGLTSDRKIIRNKIRERVISRINQGMIDESKVLLDQGILTYSRMEELGLEYKYIAKFLKGEIATQEELIEILSLKIGQFAKRQETWFRREKNVVWFDISEPNFYERVEKDVRDWYNTNK